LKFHLSCGLAVALNLDPAADDDALGWCNPFVSIVKAVGGISFFSNENPLFIHI